jgi:hypothetical protein
MCQRPAGNSRSMRAVKTSACPSPILINPSTCAFRRGESWRPVYESDVEVSPLTAPGNRAEDVWKEDSNGFEC